MRFYSTLIGLMLALAVSATSSAAAGPRLGNFDDAIAAISQARRSVMLSAYTLSPLKQTRLLGALRAAAARGVRVHVILTSEGFGYAVAQNRELAAAPGGIEVQLLDRPLHLKSLVVDGGSIVALDDENFSRCGKVLFLDTSYALPIERAAIGDPHDAPPLFVTKARALAFEAALIDRAHRSVDFETESFGPDNAVATALAGALRRGVRVNVTVNAREAQNDTNEQNELDALRGAHATIGYQNGTAKGAVIDNIGYFASANATDGLGDQIDFGFASEDPLFINALKAQLADTSGCR